MTTTKTNKKAPATETKKKGWRIKQYYVNKESLSKVKEELKSEPNQLQLIVNHMAAKFDTVDKASQGKVIVQSAIDEGSLKTVIDPAVLFAYYRKRMEAYGVTLR